MSGGSMDYLCWKLEEYAEMFEDREMVRLVKDLAKVAHDCEWFHSGDICRDTYVETVNNFKKKWLKGGRQERLKGLINEVFEEARKECMEMIGVEVEKDG